MVRGLGFTLGNALLAGGAARLPAQEAAQLPTGVTAADTAAGDSLFHTLGGCQSCHGEGGVGTDQGPGFREGRWKLGDGSYQWLVHITRHGGYGIRNRGDEPMPMRGPTVLDSAQVRRVAAYVWAISRARRPARPVAAPSN
jgi:mono/diheme cytochrome c family protein